MQPHMQLSNVQANTSLSITSSGHTGPVTTDTNSHRYYTESLHTPTSLIHSAEKTSPLPTNLVGTDWSHQPNDFCKQHRRLLATANSHTTPDSPKTSSSNNSKNWHSRRRSPEHRNTALTLRNNQRIFSPGDTGLEFFLKNRSVVHPGDIDPSVLFDGYGPTTGQKDDIHTLFSLREQYFICISFVFEDLDRSRSRSNTQKRTEIEDDLDQK